MTGNKGSIIVQGSLYTRGPRKRADYILYYKKNIPSAIIEAKYNRQAAGAGMQQVLDYAEILQLPFVLTSNGDSFIFMTKPIFTICLMNLLSLLAIC